jgi:hypothetical protein
MRKYLPAVGAYSAATNTQAVHLVLTQAHKIENLQASVKRLTDNFRSLRRRSFWKEHFKGGVFAVEFTIDKSGLYHTHLHILAFRTRFFDVQLLKDHWQDITGDSSVLRLDRIEGDINDGLREVLKYAVKPAAIADFRPDHLRDFLEMKRQRMFGTFGEFQKFARNYEPSQADPPPLATGFSDLVEGSPCPHCQEPLLEVRMQGTQLPDFLRRLEVSAAIRQRE